MRSSSPPERATDCGALLGLLFGARAQGLRLAALGLQHGQLLFARACLCQRRLARPLALPGGGEVGAWEKASARVLARQTQIIG